MRNTSSAVVAVRADGGQIVFDRETERFNGGMLNYMVDEWAPRLELRDADWIDVNGLEGATGTAQVNTKSGPRNIRLVAIRASNNAIYRFLFISKPEMTSQFAAGFRQTTYSFRELSAERGRPIAAAAHRGRPGAKRRYRRQPRQPHGIR